MQRAYTNPCLTEDGDEGLILLSERITLSDYEMEKGCEGEYASARVSAVKRLQKGVGLTTNGIVDRHSHNAIRSMLHTLGRGCAELSACW